MISGRVVPGACSLRRSCRGAVAIELALALPLLLLIAIGVVDFGQLLYSSVELSNAAEAGALYGSQTNGFASDTAGIRVAAQTDAANLSGMTVTSARTCKCPPTSGTIETTVSCATSCGAYGPPRVYVSVTTSKTVNLVFYQAVLSSAAAMSRTATFRSQ